MPLDPRRNVFRDDLAAEELRGRAVAQRYARGVLRQVVDWATPLRPSPDARTGWSSEALFGERVKVYEENDGWAWVQLAADGYVGYVRQAALGPELGAITHRVGALGTWLYPEPDLKAPPRMALSMNSLLSVLEVGSTFAKLVDGSFVPMRHIVASADYAADFVAVAERLLGAPYAWGGRTRLGVDCSGLVQLALNAAGLACPRDSDMQLAEIGKPIAPAGRLGGLLRGDLVFWSGHVGIMADAQSLVHANAHHMAVIVEPLEIAAERAARGGVAMAGVKRLPRRAARRAARP
jgi:cell wall-associated NlpC family hydrolase